MRHIIFVAFLFFAVSGRAQFFFDFPYQQMEQKREKYTPPSYKKGDAGVEEFIRKNFRQPAENERVEGRIIIAVIVDAKGKPVETHVVRSLTRSLDEEAKRVCGKMRFKPATLGKKKVKGRIDITFPISHGRVSFLDLPTIDV